MPRAVRRSASRPLPSGPVSPSRARPASRPWPEQSGRRSTSSSQRGRPRPGPGGDERIARQTRARALARAGTDASRRASAASLAASQETSARSPRALHLRRARSARRPVRRPSLDEALEGVDSLERATAQNQRLAWEARVTGDRLAALLARLSRAASSSTRRGRAVRPPTPVSPRVGRATSADGDQQRAGLTSARLAAAEAQARAAELAAERHAGCDRRRRPSRRRRAAAGARRAGAAPPGPLFVVDAVAYHLPGGRRAASGRRRRGRRRPERDPARDAHVHPGLRPASPPTSARRSRATSSTSGCRRPRPRAWGRRTVTITIYG